MAEQIGMESNGIHSSGADSSNGDARSAKERLDQARGFAEDVWKTVSGVLAKPPIGASVAGATVLAVGAFWGVTEAAVAGFAAWAVFRTLRQRAQREHHSDENGASREPISATR